MLVHPTPAASACDENETSHRSSGSSRSLADTRVDDLAPRGLKRGLGGVEVFAICAGAMLSSGLFILPGLAFIEAGPAMFLAYVLAGVMTIPALFGKAELATAMPKAGGIYFYIDRSMGAAMGTVGGLAAWFSLVFKSAFALVGMGTFTALLLPDVSEMELRVVAAAFCILFTVVNLRGVHDAGRLQVVMVFGLLAILIVYAIVGFGQTDPARFEPFMPQGFDGLLMATGMVFVAFGGVTKAASVAEEVKDPGRTLPLGMFAAFIVVLITYAAVTAVTVGVVDPNALRGTLTPINLGAEPIFGTVGVIAVTVAAILAFVSTANAGIMAGSRMPMAMSRDRLLPRALESVHPRRGTPTAAILMTGGAMTLVVLFLDLEDLVKTASTLMLMLFVGVNVTVILMRQSRLQSYRPVFRSPMYPWLQIAGIIGYCVLIAAMGLLPILLATGFVAASLVWFLVYGRRRQQPRASALTHVMGRVDDSDLTNPRSLGNELCELVREREGMDYDRFDRLVESCSILDVTDGPTLDALLARAEKSLAGEIDAATRDLATLAAEEQPAAAALVTRNVASAHRAILGSGRFHLVVARCRQGVALPDADSKVRAVFLLVCSDDQRRFQQRALEAITQIAQQPDFDDRWQRAVGGQDLRHLLLLSRRKRYTDLTSAAAMPAL